MAFFILFKSLQSKQEALLKSMEQISEECESLKTQLNVLEGERENLNRRLKDSRKKTGADWRNYKECVKRFLTLIFSLPNSLWATGKQV